MIDHVIRPMKPEETELQNKQEELHTVEWALADRELVLASLHSDLLRFERMYIRLVGHRFAQLDEVNAKIAEQLANELPRNEQARSSAGSARAQANSTRASVEELLAQGIESKTAPRSQTLKNTYREVAKRIHPDLASGDEDRIRRQVLMADANRAFEEGDEERLKQILEDYNSSAEAVNGEGTGADLIRTIRKIARAKRRISEIDDEILKLQKSELAKLRARVDQASKEGRDLFAEIVRDVDTQIAASQTRLDGLVRASVNHESQRI